MVHCNGTSTNYAIPYDTIMDEVPQGCWREVFGAIFVFNSLAAIFLNGSMLLIMWQNKSLRSPSNTILSALAFVDFIMGSAVAPLFAAQLLNAHIIKLKGMRFFLHHPNFFLSFLHTYLILPIILAPVFLSLPPQLSFLFFL